MNGDNIEENLRGMLAEIDMRLGDLGVTVAVENSASMPLVFREAGGGYRVLVSGPPAVRLIRCLRAKAGILCGHFTRDDAAERRLFGRFFRRNLHIILFRLPDGALSRLGVCSAYIYARFSALARAMEVNSRLFGGGLWRQVRELPERARAEDADRNGADIPGLDCGGFPKEGWPLGLDWMSYLILLCSDMAAGLDAIGGLIRTGDIGKCERALRDAEALRSACLSRPLSLLSDGGGGVTDEGRARKGRTTGGTPGTPMPVTASAVSGSVRECRDIPALIRTLRERGVAPGRKNIVTDITHHHNRNRLGGSLLVPRRFRADGRTRAPVCILLDVSGSVPAAFLRQLVRAVTDAEGAFDRRASRLVSWADGLCADTSLDALDGVSAGGGTALAGGIDYCKRYLRGNAAFFIISDLRDDIGGWISAARGIRARKTVIVCADTDADAVPDGISDGGGAGFAEWFARVGSNADYRKTEVTLKEFSRVFDCILLRAAVSN